MQSLESFLLRASPSFFSPLLSSLWNLVCNRLRRWFLPYLLRRSKTVYPRIALNVRRLTESVVVKSSTLDKLHLEADALRYIAQHTRLPVPRVYDVWCTDPKTNTGYIAMQYIPGQMVGLLWKQLTADQKQSFMRRLGQHLDEIRALRQPAPTGWIGSLDGKASYDRFALPLSTSTWGPFKDEAAYNDWRLSTTTRAAESSPKAAHRLAQLRAEMSDSHRICFTHGDITNRNVLVRLDGNGVDDVRIVSILDWEQAGWRPEYWEMFKIRYAMSGHEFSTVAKDVIFPMYDRELALESEMIMLAGIPT